MLVLGYIVRGPLGGLAWHHLQYVLGLARLGHEVYFLEDCADYPSCYDPSTDSMGTDASYGLRFIASTFENMGLGDRWGYLDFLTGGYVGPLAERILRICTDADLLLNLSGVNPLRPWLLDVPVRVLVDTDPVFTQIRHLTDPAAREAAAQHTAFATFGENFGAVGCGIPDDGFPWRRTRQPVVLDAWQVVSAPADGAFTTVMQWDSYMPRKWGGHCFGMKSKSFGPYLDLPSRTGATLELALGSATAPREMLQDNGWRVRNSLEPTRDPQVYQQYIQQSRGEFSVAKHGYVAAHSGWFSERSAGYLASGRPVVLQDTGFSEWLPTGTGVLAFRSPGEALEGIEEVCRDHPRHCRVAREVATEYFDSSVVLPALLESVCGLA